MTLVANFDTALEQHYTDAGAVGKEFQIFGIVWNMLPLLSTAQLAPLMKIQAAAEAMNDPQNAASPETRMFAMSLIGDVPEMLSLIVVEDQRRNFRQHMNEKGIPLSMLPAVLEAIFAAYDAAPLPSATNGLTSSTPAQQPASTSGSTSLSTPAGQSSRDASSLQPFDMPPAPGSISANPQAIHTMQPTSPAPEYAQSASLASSPGV